jgi:hypothetical protein
VVNLNTRLLVARAQSYADAVAAKCDDILTNVIGFVDGTLRPTARYRFIEILDFVLL